MAQVLISVVGRVRRSPSPDSRGVPPETELTHPPLENAQERAGRQLLERIELRPLRVYGPRRGLIREHVLLSATALVAGLLGRSAGSCEWSKGVVNVSASPRPYMRRPGLNNALKASARRLTAASFCGPFIISPLSIRQSHQEG